MENQQNRTLGAFEKTFWLLDQIDSKDFVLAAEIDGRETEEAWQLAIKKVQQRHPNLSVKIVMDPFHRPVLKHVPGMEIPLRTVDVENDYRWEQEAEKELSTRFNTETGPLVRVVLVQKPENTVLLVAASHTISDGTSLTYFIRDVLSAVTGQELEPMKAQRSNDEEVGFPEDVAIVGQEQATSLENNFKPVFPKVSTLRIDRETTHKIIEKSRLEGTTVHGVLCAAVLIASRKMRPEWADKKIEMISPVCSRRALKLDDNFGLNITTQAVYFEEEQHLTFWDIARLAKAELEGTHTVEHVKNYLGIFRDLTFNSADLQRMIEVLKEAFNHQIMVTNLGRAKFHSDFGKLQIKALYGPMVRSGKGHEQTVGAITCNGSLSLTNTSDSPITGLLPAIEKIVREACE
ncbi:MAG: condensation domain-containing protein [Pedobacter sp.]|uniref:condensation domain-containing protein n=1 Tax=Pedobacter sp. TaxID=1411316 RepID=UPI0033971FEF